MQVTVYFNILVTLLLERFNPAYCTCTGHLRARKHPTSTCSNSWSNSLLSHSLASKRIKAATISTCHFLLVLLKLQYQKMQMLHVTRHTSMGAYSAELLTPINNGGREALYKQTMNLEDKLLLSYDSNWNVDKIWIQFINFFTLSEKETPCKISKVFTIIVLFLYTFGEDLDTFRTVILEYHTQTVWSSAAVTILCSPTYSITSSH